MKKAFISLGIVFLMFAVSCTDSSLDEIANTIKPESNFSVTAELFQAGQKIEFKDLSTDEDGFITGWNWDFGDGNSSNDQSPTHFFEIGGTFTVKLVAIDNTGSAGAEYSKSIEIAEDPYANIAEPYTKWAFELPAVINHTSPAIMDNGVVLMGCNLDDVTRKPATGPIPPNFFAIQDGSKLWETALYEGGGSYSDRILTSPSIAENGVIYMASFYSRNIYQLNAGTGVIENEFYTNSRLRYSAPAIGADGTVYQGGYSKSGKGFYALDSSLNSMKWVFKAGDDFHSTPAIGSDGTIYISSEEDYFYAVNPDGTEKWSANYGTWAATAVAIGPDDTVYFAGENAGEGVFIAFNSNDGAEKWRKNYPAKVNHGGPAIAADGTIYIGGYEEKMFAYNADGTEKWSYTAKGPIETVPAIDNDGNIYFGDLSGFFHVVDSTGKNPFKVVKLGDEINSSAAIGSDGTIYVGANEGSISRLYALQTNATGLATGGWPMFAKDAKHTSRK